MTPSADVNLTALRITSRFDSGVLVPDAPLVADAGVETGSEGALAKRGGRAGSADGNKVEVVGVAVEAAPGAANKGAVAELAADERVVEEAAYE